jgi:hypothetical protein
VPTTCFGLLLSISYRSCYAGAALVILNLRLCASAAFACIFHYFPCAIHSPARLLISQYAHPLLVRVLLPVARGSSTRFPISSSCLRDQWIHTLAIGRSAFVWEQYGPQLPVCYTRETLSGVFLHRRPLSTVTPARIYKSCRPITVPGNFPLLQTSCPVISWTNQSPRGDSRCQRKIQVIVFLHCIPCVHVMFSSQWGCAFTLFYRLCYEHHALGRGHCVLRLRD